MNRGLSLLGAGILAVLGLALLLACASYASDQIRGASPTSANLLGPGGAWIAHHSIGSWGLATFVLPLACFGLAISLLGRRGGHYLPRRVTGIILLVPALAGLAQLLPADGWAQGLLIRWDMQRLGGLGGNVGWLLAGPAIDDHPAGILRRHLDVGGTALVLVLASVACIALIQMHLLAGLRRAVAAAQSYPQTSPTNRPSTSGVRGQTRPLSRRDTTPARPATVPPATTSERERERQATDMKLLVRRIQDEDALPADAADAADLVERIRRRRAALASGQEVDEADLAPRASTPPADPEPVAAVVTPAPPARPPTEDQAEEPVVDEPIAESPPLRESTPPPIVDTPKPTAAKPKPRRKPVDSDGYNLPPVDLLDHVPLRDDARHEQEKTSTARAIEETFANFGVKVGVVAASRGPVITMYEIQLMDQAMRVNKVEGFEKDLSLKLGTEGIRIVAPLPNKKTIGIEVPNKAKEAVVMRDLVETMDASQMILPMILGRDVIGNALVGDLGKMPHLLVAGATGTGKSVCMNAMICSILLFRGPDEVKFIMVDPKMVELAGYEDIPHLLTPPITDMTKAHAALEWACRCMDERYFALRLVGVRDIKAYNELGEAEIRNRLARKGKTLEDLPGIEVRMPFIVVLVDEYADLMMVNKEVEKSIIRLTQKSRAAGIHVILTTQRPSADVVTGLIKSNLPARICFRVADKSNSRVVLDSGGAECLLGRGDMLYLPPGTNALIRGQGVWVKDKEIDAIIEHAKSQGEPQYDESITSVGAVAMAAGGSVGSGGGAGGEWIADRAFHEAVQAMYRYNRSGADFFRRKLNIGYNKATSYVEQLEDLGFLGPQKGTAPREVIKSWDDWLDLLKSQGLVWDEEDELYHDPNAMGGVGRE